MKSMSKVKYLLQNKKLHPGLFRPLHDNANGIATGPLNTSTIETLQDLHGRKHDYLRISLTERCNLRCQYCMPAEGAPLSPRPQLLARDELLRLARVFAALGVTKLRLTGGEPTLRSDIVDIVRELSLLPGIRTVAMTSNGLALTRRLPALQRAGLSALNLSLDTLRPERFERMTRRPGLARVLASIDLALQLGYSPVKVNTVLMKGFNDDEICDFADFTKERDVEVRFIEFMPFSGNEWHDKRMVPEREALAALRERHPEIARMRGAGCDTAALWAAPGHRGRLGFISSMTRPFCAGCNRLRLTADGNLKVCLFGAAETSLRDALRAGASDDDLAALVRAALRRKLPQHAGQYLLQMYLAPASPTSRHEKRRYISIEKPTDDSYRWIMYPAPRPPSGATWRLSRRAYSTGAGGGRLTHLDEEGRARMVDVGEKVETTREAEAECYVQVSKEVLRLLRAGGGPKGDALGVAELAGVMAAKRTAELIPLCHALPLANVRVRLYLPEDTPSSGRRVRVWCVARAYARTGVEMEALTGCALAALALYDMCKAADRHMCVTGLRVLRKSGGANDWTALSHPQDTEVTGG